MIILSDLSEVHARGIIGTDRFLAAKYAVSSIGQKAIKDKCWRRQGVPTVQGAFKDLLRGRISEDEYWQEFFEKGRWLFDMEDAKEALSKNLRDPLPDPATHVLERIMRYPRSLAGDFGFADGMPTIYLVSDHIESRLQEVKNAHPGIFKLFAREFWSCRMGCIKEDRGFFPTVIDEGHLKPEEVILIDDNIKNIAAASRFGIQGILYQSSHQLETELRDKYGFEFGPAIP